MVWAERLCVGDLRADRVGSFMMAACRAVKQSVKQAVFPCEAGSEAGSFPVKQAVKQAVFPVRCHLASKVFSDLSSIVDLQSKAFRDLSRFFDVLRSSVICRVSLTFSVRPSVTCRDSLTF